VWLDVYPGIGAMWMEKGVQLKIRAPGINRRVNVFIAMLYPSGALIRARSRGGGASSTRCMRGTSSPL